MKRTTHEVFNQSTDFADVNLFTGNRALADALRFNLPGCDEARFVALGAELGSAEMQRHARLANHFAPSLKSHDRFGRRIDQVDFHPGYHALMAAAMRHGLHGTPWFAGPGAHVERAAAFMLFTECEPSILCPISMTYAVTPALRANRAILRQWGPGLASDRYDPRFLPFDEKSGLTMGMGMTEKQGGSDVRANTTRAEYEADDAWGRRYRITGHKWFCSAPMCDAFLILAQAPAGLSCFFLPRIRPDGSVNAFAVQRLKHKLGNHANASSEVEFDAATAWLVGEEGRGVAQILAMGTITRLDCAPGTAGLMRHALALALHHAAGREAFGRRLIDQPMMKNVLADLALESEAATALALRLARAVERSENGDDGHEALIRRVLTPVAKFWICKRGSHFAQETMECLGGNGYVEEHGEGVMARIYREMPLNSIWEGAGNIMALDLLRALRSAEVGAALEREVAPVRGAHPAIAATLETVRRAIAGAVDEARARRLARDVALLLQAVLLRQHSTEAVFDAFCASRLAGSGAGDVFGLLPAGVDTAAIVARAAPGARG
ncbi:acyl-CoA dehydrogenase family protein [Accumulibacter sp.]|uniref:acyl-CoA dehydrogenase family protein n=1 Tax=Accumulibacter sp. TaxID=2053492 RepID=UPI0026001DED|nr:acyl-CoA dehydrogenase family protein [Accumulibacter sp.]MCM8595732.1 acyl-CoA dehydrogenase family protein [Accumulibacter sp.]MDS4049879.1 acyl-CoA dehydrogenase family protein [Accumulibacter sp.]